MEYGRADFDGLCEADYEALRSQTRISFVVYDGYFAACSKVVNLTIGHYDGGYQAGQYARELGHTKALCLADNDLCMDKERMDGFRAAFAPGKKPCFGRSLRCKKNAVLIMRSIFAAS